MSRPRNLARDVGALWRPALVLLAALALYLGYVVMWETPALDKNVGNPRAAEDLGRRGAITDRSGAPLASTQWQQGRLRRMYPAAAAAAQVVGWVNTRYGKSGLERTLDRWLQAPRRPPVWEELRLALTGKPLAGDTVTLTLDLPLQRAAARALGRRTGAVVVLDPRTGAILALASSPAYDPNHLDRLWPALIRDTTGAPLINRALEGHYPPGSVFKLVTMAAVLASDVLPLTTTYDCRGSVSIGNYVVHDAEGRGHGVVDLTRALVESCNVAFAQLGVALGPEPFARQVAAFGLDHPADIELPQTPPALREAPALSRTELAQEAFGQGMLAVAPIHVAEIAAAIANGGVLMDPFLVERITAPDGTVVFQTTPRVFATPMTPDTAARLRDMMVLVVKEGTGTRAQIRGITVAGKTGTAEHPRGRPHAWFVAFAPAEAPRIVVAVVVENSGWGGAVAAPIAKAVLEEALGRVPANVLSEY